MDKTNKERLDLLIGFLENDKEGGDMANVEKAAAEFLRLNWTYVIGIADAYDEFDAKAKTNERIQESRTA
jgi:hypothetical protein